MSARKKNIVPIRNKQQGDNKETVLVICRFPNGEDNRYEKIPIPVDLSDKIKEEMVKHDVEGGELVIDHGDVIDPLLSRYELLQNVISMFEAKVLTVDSNFNNRLISKDKVISYSDDRTCQFKDMDSVTYIFTIKPSTLEDSLQIRFGINPNTTRDIDLEITYFDQGRSSVSYQDIHADDMDLNIGFFNKLIRWYVSRYRNMVSKRIVVQGRLEDREQYQKDLFNIHLKNFDIVARDFVYAKDMKRLKQD